MHFAMNVPSCLFLILFFATVAGAHFLLRGYVSKLAYVLPNYHAIAVALDAS